jgi:DNA-binding MarR family transcriptional regulator
MTTTPEVLWLDHREMTAWRAYVETFADLGAVLDADLKPHGMSLGDYQVLVYLSEAEQARLRMCDLADRLQLSPSGLTRRLDGLVRAGLVTRDPSAEDRRVMLAVLTDEGRARLEAVAPHHVASVRRHLIDLLSTSQLEVMADIFTLVRAHLDATPPGMPAREIP